MKIQVIERYQLFNQNHRSVLSSIFDKAVPLNLLDSLSTSSSGPLEALEQEEVETSIISEEGSHSSKPTSVDVGLLCSTCGINFGSLKDQRQHFQLDWHRYNLKRKSHDQEPVNEEEFGQLLDGLSSISGSDADEESPSTVDHLNRLLTKVSLNQPSEEESVASESRLNFALNKHVQKFFHNSQNNDVFAVYKSLLPSRIQSGGPEIDFVEHLKLVVDTPPMWAFVMISGGHFAAGIFRGSTEVVHKTFHSYTVRAKQGGSQGSRDGKSSTSHPKSAGASLRRYNEQAFKQHVQDLLASWKEKLSLCQLIFYRAVSFNQNILFGGPNSPLDKSDSRLRTIPFPTKRPTYNEVKRVLHVLSTIDVLGSVDEFREALFKRESWKTNEENTKHLSSPKTKFNRAKSRSPTRREEPPKPPSSSDASEDVEFEIQQCEEVIDFQTTLQEYGDSLTAQQRKKRSKKKKTDSPENVAKPAGIVGNLLTALEGKNEEEAKKLIAQMRSEFGCSEEVWNQKVDAQWLTLLHYAAKNDLYQIVWLLLESGCNPSYKDKSSKVPYNLASSKEGRKVFMRFQAEFPDKYDYSKAQIPGPLTKEMEQERAEKQKLLNKLKREKEKLKKQEKKEKQLETDEQERFLKLSDREKRALAAERRILGQATRTGEAKPILVRCFECATDITGKVPFEYNQNVFCTTKCMTTHRKKFPVPLSL